MTRARRGPEAHPVAGVRCDAAVATDVRATLGGRRSVLRLAASRERFSARIGASGAPRGAGHGVDFVSSIVRRIDLFSKKNIRDLQGRADYGPSIFKKMSF